MKSFGHSGTKGVVFSAPREKCEFNAKPLEPIRVGKFNERRLSYGAKMQRVQKPVQTNV